MNRPAARPNIHPCGIVVAILAVALGASPVAAQLNEAKLTAGDGVAGDQFGFAVAVSGDRALVGAFGSSGGGDSSGAAYVFEFDGVSWTETAKLVASDASAEDLFGYAVALDGDRALVGAPGDDAEAGAAYVFDLSGGGWTESAKLTASDSAAADDFGISVALDSDRALIGAFGDDAFTGAAYVFDRGASGWAETAKLVPATAAPGDDLGVSVALDGDRALVGADGDGDNGAAAGAAWVFELGGSGWSETAKLVAADGAAFDFLGYSVALDGDRAVVGSSLDDDFGNSSGAAYVFEFDGSTWGQTKLSAADGQSGDYLGTAVAVAGDRVFGGAYGDDDLGDGAGSLYEWDGSGAGWSQQAKRTAADGVAGDGFGVAVAIDGDHVVTGAAGAAGGTGAVYAFTTSVVGTHDYLFLAESHIVVDRQFATVGDVHSNGDIDFVAGTPSQHEGAITAVDDIDIGPLYLIFGDVTAGGTADVSPITLVVGTVTSNAAVAPVALPAPAFPAGGANVTVPNNATVNLASGSYGHLRVGSRATLVLRNDGTSGDYYFLSADVRDRAVVLADVTLGTIAVNVVGDVGLDDRAQLQRTPASAPVSGLAITTLGNFVTSNRAVLIGRLAAPYGTVRLGRRVSLEGWICADEIEVDRFVVANVPTTAVSRSFAIPREVGRRGLESAGARP